MENVCGATFVFDHEGEPDLIGNDLTGGAYRVMVGRAAAGEGPPMHIHPHTDEGFYIGEGEMTFVFGDRQVVAGPGSFVFVARGVEHTGAHHTAATRPAHLLARRRGAHHTARGGSAANRRIAGPRGTDAGPSVHGGHAVSRRVVPGGR